MQIKKFAAIDIGSNSVRLLIEHVMESEKEVLFKKNALVRVPVRLGEAAFTSHKIPEATIVRLIDAMQSFRYLMKANEVLHYKGGATSALREAQNGAAIVRRIEEETGVKIQIISGATEAKMIFASQKSFATKLKDKCLFVDVGGGSTEMTLFSKGEIIAAESFDIGTIRILNNLITKESWKPVREWLKQHAKKADNLSIIGSGGNINRIAKLAELKSGKAMSFEALEEIIRKLKTYSIEDRMRLFDLNPDRADVIVPAGEIFLEIMRMCDSKKVFVPKIGLSDGMVRDVYAEYKAMVNG